MPLKKAQGSSVQTWVAPITLLAAVLLMTSCIRDARTALKEARSLWLDQLPKSSFRILDDTSDYVTAEVALKDIPPASPLAHALEAPDEIWVGDVSYQLRSSHQPKHVIYDSSIHDVAVLVVWSNGQESDTLVILLARSDSIGYSKGKDTQP